MVDIDTDKDGIGNLYDLDDDNDGLFDDTEIIWGTNPLVADTDNDNVIDGEDVSLLIIKNQKIAIMMALAIMLMKTMTTMD